MDILVLDDQEIVTMKPESYFVDPHDYTEDTIEQYDRVEPFLEALFSRVWDEVWFDHDLGMVADNGKQATYKVLEKFKVEGILPEVGLVRITTNNPSAGKNMFSDIEMTGLNVIQTPIYTMGDYGVSRGKFFNAKK